MMYPKGEAIYQNLSTEYTNLSQLLSALKPKEFSGIVELETAGTKGAFFIVSGEIVNAASGIENDPPAAVGEEAAERLLAFSNNPDGVINVYQLPSGEVESAANSLVKSELVFKDLSSDFVKLDQFVKKLQVEKFTGYLEMSNKKNRRTGTLSLRNGELISLKTVPESGVSSFFESEAVPPVLEEFAEEGTSFNVYRSKVFSMPVKESKRTVETGKKTVESRRSKPELFGKLDVKEEEIFEVQLEEKPVFWKKQDIIEEKIEEKPNISKALDFVEETKVENNAGNGRNEFLMAIQRLFLKMEKFMDSFSEKGIFQKTLKKACVEKSETYHFLDPFAGQFDYQGKKIYLDEQVGTEEFIKAIAECLSLSLSYIKKELPKNVGFPPGLKGDIESTFKKYQDIIKPVF